MKKARKNNLKRQTVMLKTPGATIQCKQLRRSQAVREEWREQTMRGIERLCALTEVGDQEALGRLKAVEDFLRAVLEYLQAAERFDCASGTDDPRLNIPSSTAEARTSFLH